MWRFYLRNKERRDLLLAYKSVFLSTKGKITQSKGIREVSDSFFFEGQYL